MFEIKTEIHKIKMKIIQLTVAIYSDDHTK